MALGLGGLYGAGGVDYRMKEGEKIRVAIPTKLTSEVSGDEVSPSNQEGAGNATFAGNGESSDQIGA